MILLLVTVLYGYYGGEAHIWQEDDGTVAVQMLAYCENGDIHAKMIDLKEADLALVHSLIGLYHKQKCVHNVSNEALEDYYQQHVLDLDLRDNDTTILDGK